MINENKIVIFSYGDGYKASTWSNIPFFLINTLKNKGFDVININVQPKKTIISIGYSLIYKLLCKCKRKQLYISYDRSNFFDKYVNKVMKETVSKYSDTICFISTSFSFHPKKYTDKPCIMFCDWDIEFSIKKISNREIDRLELKSIYNQKKYLQTSDLNITLFEDVEKYYKENTDVNMKCIGNVINLPEILISDKDLNTSFVSKHILFIGRKKYVNALDSLIKSMKYLDQSVVVDVIGMDKINSYENVNFYGYLNKEIPNEFGKYISLIKEAKIVINTNEIWAGFSSLIECMYLYKPIIVSQFDTFVEMFGTEIDFGIYSENKPKEIAKNINNIFNLDYEEYTIMCKKAHEVSKEFTWDSFVDKLLETILKERRD